jgi:hypothetical protein
MPRAANKSVSVPAVKVPSSRAPIVSSQTSGSSLAVTEAPKFKAGDYLPGDLFSVSSSVPYLSESEYESYREQIRGQQRAIEVAQENLKLSRQILKSEGLAIDCEIEVSNNRIKLQDLTTTNVKLSQAQVKTSIEEAKLAELNHDLQGYTQQASLKQQTWSLKLEGLRHDIEVATHLLDEKRKAFQAQLSHSR